MDTFFQLVALLASGIVIAMYGWSALAVRRWVELVPNGLVWVARFLQVSFSDFASLVRAVVCSACLRSRYVLLALMGPTAQVPISLANRGCVLAIRRGVLSYG